MQIITDQKGGILLTIIAYTLFAAFGALAVGLFLCVGIYGSRSSFVADPNIMAGIKLRFIIGSLIGAAATLCATYWLSRKISH